VFNQLGTVDRCDQKFHLSCVQTAGGMHRAAKLPLQNRAIDFTQHRFCALIFHTYYDSIGMEKVLHGGAFTQEFRVRCDTQLHPVSPAIEP